MALSGTQNSINNPTPISQLRAPRGFVLINGISVPWEYFEISNARYGATGTFHVTIPVNALPKTIAFPLLMQTSPLVIQINAGIPRQVIANNATPSDVPLVIMGNADEVKYEPHNSLITISGRDYISLFTDNKIGQTDVSPSAAVPIDLTTILGLTYSSAVVSQLATSRGLTPVVTTTTNPIGKYFQSQYAMLNSQITEWDLMTFLARQEQFDIFVLGKNLYFQPKSTSTPYQITIAVPYYTTSTALPVSNVQQITFTRNYKLANNIIVNISSWNVKDKIAYSSVASLIHTDTVPADTQIYNYTFPNLTQEQCNQKAANLLQEISQHEMAVNITMPADELMTAQTILSVKDTGTLFDQTYYVKNVTREMRFGSGFEMTIEAKNQSPYSMTVT